MAIPISCATCGEKIGSNPSSKGLWPECNIQQVPCSGRHTAPVFRYTKDFFGWTRRVLKVYPETGTRSIWWEYTGPHNRLALAFVMIFGPFGVHKDGLFVRGERLLDVREVFSAKSKKLFLKPAA